MARKQPFRIGYVDYQLGNYHANVYLEHTRGELKSRGFEIAGAWGMDEKIGKAWCDENKVPWFDQPALNDAVDGYMVLAPSNPELHLDLCKRCLPFGKPTYVDKTFAPDVKTARAIFRLADKHGCPMQTTSALRYTNVQAHAREVGHDAIQHMVAWGGGRSFEEYAIHPVELVVSCMGADVRRLMRRGKGEQGQLLLDFTGGRTAVVNVYAQANTPFAASVTTGEATTLLTVDGSRLFVDALAAIFDFFKAGQPNIDRAESLAVRKILDAAALPEATSGFVKV